MPIPDEQIRAWANIGAVQTAKATCDSIRKALEEGLLPGGQDNFEVYLQGSYRNSTNIRGDADVDVVAQLRTGHFSYDLSGLAEEQRKRFARCHMARGKVFWAYTSFRRTVLECLRAYYCRGAVGVGAKSLKVKPSPGRLPADVIACVPHRRYERFNDLFDQAYVEGIMFRVGSHGPRIVNFPRQHYENGVRKNSPSGTDGAYKPMVRVFKNARNELLSSRSGKKTLPLGATPPSYFIECLLYNVPDYLFDTDLSESFHSIVDWLSKAKMRPFKCQHEQALLFGESREQWPPRHARVFVNGLKRLCRTG